MRKKSTNLGKIFHQDVDRIAQYKPPGLSPWQKEGLWLYRTERTSIMISSRTAIPRPKMACDPMVDYAGDFATEIGVAVPIYIELKARLVKSIIPIHKLPFDIGNEITVSKDQLTGLLHAKERGTLAYFLIMYQQNSKGLPSTRLNEIIATEPRQYVLLDPKIALMVLKDANSLRKTKRRVRTIKIGDCGGIGVAWFQHLTSLPAAVRHVMATLY